MKLYELSEQYQQLQELSALDDDDMAMAIRDTVEGIEGQFDDKAIDLVKYTRNMDTDIEAVDAEIKRLQSRKRVMQNKKEALKDYLRDNMGRTGIMKIECPLFTINYVPAQDIVDVTDADSVPDEYVQIERKPKKADIKAALKEGKEIEGVRLVPGKASIRIR